MNLSVMSFSHYKLVMDETIDLYGYLEMVRYRFGLSVADVWNRMLVPQPQGDIWARILADADAAYLGKVKRALAERGLTLANIAVDGANLWDDDPGVRAQNRHNALVHLRVAAMLGAQTLRIDTGGSKSSFEWTNEQFDWIVRLYREYANIAASEGLRVGPENHGGAEVIPAMLMRLCQAVDHPAFGVLLHFKRWKGEQADQGDTMIAPWVMHTHVSNAVTPDELYDKMTALRNTGYNGCWSVECPTTRMTELEIWLARMKDVLARWEEEKA